MRLPLQVGRAAIGQGARFAATIWTGPLLLLLGTMVFYASHPFIGIAIVLGGIVLLGVAIEAADVAKRDRPSDIVLDGSGFAIQGGPLDGTHCKWSEVDADSCTVVHADPRIAVRWLLLKWLTLGKIDWIADRAEVPVVQLQLRRAGEHDLVLAEVEGDERESLVHLRDAIRSVADPPEPDGEVKLPQEILTCPACGAPQVPADAATMPCASCGHVLEVPAELRERLHARAVLEQTSAAPARLVRRLVDQPSAKRAGWIVRQGRRLMFWSQPAALVGLIVYMTHQGGHTAGTDETFLLRMAPSEDGLFLQDLALAALMVAAAFVIAWTLTSAYVANRAALRVLADQFGAVPPARRGGASSCRRCGAPLPASTALLVHCVYCAAENVIGVDPRPAALRRKREHVDLARALRRRRLVRLLLWIALPLCVALGAATAHELRLAWGVPKYTSPEDGKYAVYFGAHGTIVNHDLLPRSVALDGRHDHARATVLGHGTLYWVCSGPCTVTVGGDHLPVAYSDTDPNQPPATALEIRHGALRKVSP